MQNSVGGYGGRSTESWPNHQTVLRIAKQGKRLRGLPALRYVQPAAVCVEDGQMNKEMEVLLERIKRIKALAEKGVGGEKEEVGE